MGVLAALGAEIAKMFAADFRLSLTAVATIGLCAVGLRLHALPPADLPFLLAGGIVAALAVGVVRGAPRDRR
ncbi:MAG: hypothetical protein H0X27_05365 [Caulobacteraceae bacterium]|nr:hypothetical protein [Caulobacteraceae bacterium]